MMKYCSICGARLNVAGATVVCPRPNCSALPLPANLTEILIAEAATTAVPLWSRNTFNSNFSQRRLELADWRLRLEKMS